MTRRLINCCKTNRVLHGNSIRTAFYGPKISDNGFGFRILGYIQGSLNIRIAWLAFSNSTKVVYVALLGFRVIPLFHDPQGCLDAHHSN